MNDTDRIFLNILRNGIQNNTNPERQNLPANDKAWEGLFECALQQGVLPLVLDTVCEMQDRKNIGKELLKHYRDIAVKEAVTQIVQTNEFLTLLLHLQQKGLSPIVVKGIVCRSLYPKPMLRPSVDEDLLIDQTERERYHESLIAEGLFADDPVLDRATAHTWSYHKENSPTYIELQSDLFEPSSEAYGDLNSLFKNAAARAVTLQIEDVTVRTLHPTDHLVFLLCHAMKHFMHGGLGIRPVCDICLFIREYHDQIDWDEAAESGRKVRMTGLAAGILRICEQYLGLDGTMVRGPLSEEVKAIDEKDLLEDILESGLFGMASTEQIHSGTFTLQAVADARKGKSEGRSMIRTIFPSAKYMNKKYPYLSGRPWLLPAAWVQRIASYSLRKVNGRRAKPMESLRIGRSRVELMKKYKILE